MHLCVHTISSCKFTQYLTKKKWLMRLKFVSVLSWFQHYDNSAFKWDWRWIMHDLKGASAVFLWEGDMIKSPERYEVWNNLLNNLLIPASVMLYYTFLSCIRVICQGHCHGSLLMCLWDIQHFQLHLTVQLGLPKTQRELHLLSVNSFIN